LIIKHHHMPSFFLRAVKPGYLEGRDYHLDFAGRRPPVCTESEKRDWLQRYNATGTDLHSHWCLIT
jgi:hypothetical protein